MSFSRHGRRKNLRTLRAAYSVCLVEALERRLCFSTFTVTTLADSGGGVTLRQAITSANTAGGTDLINFANGLSGTISLGGALPAFTANITIDGPGANELTVNGNSHGSVFSINQGLTAEIENLTITGGSGTAINGSNYGGGIFNRGSLTVTDSTISGNTASGSDGGGAGIYTNEFAGSLTVNDSTISGNTAGFFGGGINMNYGTTTVTDSTITGNIAQMGGGFFGRGTETFTDSTVSGNLANSTGGIYVDFGTLGSFSTTVDGSIIANNFGGDFANTGKGTASGSNDLIGDGSDGGVFSSSLRGTSANPLNPMLGSLANNGGPTPTMAILSGSPAIGESAVFAAAGGVDQRGVARPSVSVDIGAYQSSFLVVNTLGDPSTPTAGILSLHEAIADADSLGNRTIEFISGLQGTINLASTLPNISANTTIDGPGASVLTVNGNSHGSVFSINQGVTAAIENLEITGGTGTPTNGSNYGGGIHNLGNLTVTDSTISGNTASGIDGGGGGIYSSAFAGSLTVVDSTISGNTANYFGGGINLNYGTLTVTDSTITDNIAHKGGGFFGRGSETFTDSTISGNLANIIGGLYIDLGTQGAFSNTVDGTIIAANFGGDFTNAGSKAATGSNDLIGDGSDGGVFTSSLRGTTTNPLNPLLASPAFNGGPTPTMALDIGSPALAAGASFGGITTDQRGAPRPSGAGIDIGAFQVLTVNTLTDPLFPTTGILSLREAIIDSNAFGGSQEITFAPGLTGSIVVGSVLPDITTNLVIDGPGVSVLTVNGESFGSVFSINPSVAVEINDLTLTGGGISDNGSLTTEGNVISGAINGNGSLTVGNGLAAKLTLNTGAGDSTVNSLTLGANATLDITNNSLAINYGSGTDPVAAVAAALTSGYAGGAWTGIGIDSSTAATGNPNEKLAVGYNDGKTDSGSAAAGQILVKYTLAGDTNLDELTNFGDLVAVLQNFNKGGTDWAHGNFAYGASTNFGDLVTVLQNFNKTLTPPASAAQQLGGTTLPLVQSEAAPAKKPTPAVSSDNDLATPAAVQPASPNEADGNILQSNSDDGSILAS